MKPEASGSPPARGASSRGVRTEAGSSFAPSSGPSLTATACSTAFSSSRTFPGQS